ncbi:MAG: glycoside hydrolase family 88 protein [Bacteroidales bacterium]|nr:glycoside hydrolase family 88 protein [Bacteroidales bacterium]
MQTKVFLFFSVFFALSCSKGNNETVALIEKNLELAVEQYKAMDLTVADSLFPRSTKPDGSLMTNKSWWWTSGFYPGSLWYLYEFSGDTAILSAAQKKLKALEKEQYSTYDHDIGFKMLCSYGNAYRITSENSYVPIIVNSAKSLLQRYDSTVRSIRSWDDIGDTAQFKVIIDNMMNLELLFWATHQTGDSIYYYTAVEHANTTLANHFRPDGSSYHLVSYKPQTGEVLYKKTVQGFADSSAWARGQAWGLYGYVVCYRETTDPSYLAIANKIAGLLINHPNLPADKIPYWDFNAPDIPGAKRDASAAAIMASALIELASFTDGNQRKLYLAHATEILKSLSSDVYRAKTGENNNFLLKHSVGHLPANSEVDVPLSYADYYYIEALLRLKKTLK